ncbi:MAG: hypothetical protein M1825_006493 [Sarcosagium campestre]|nr:MAG: hypothetical protein M1825_006493 [Sarcosagium campestre]
METTSVLSLADSDPHHGSGAVATTNAAARQKWTGNDLSLRPVQPVDILFRNLTLSVDITPISWHAIARKIPWQSEDDGNRRKTILDDVSAEIPHSSLTAIMGSSGSGKDVLLSTLTVRETLQYAADLRLPSPLSREERIRIVDEVILELGMKEAANTRIGNSEHKGCSGGEKRRVSIGIQLLANPSILYLDEPTTGLDATSAFQIVRTLKNLAQKGRTIIFTVHQPRSEIWSQFDNLILLSRGAALYSGPASEAVAHFERQGFPMPAFVNPAEHLIDLAAIDNRSPELEVSSVKRVDSLRDVWLHMTAKNPSQATPPKSAQISSSTSATTFAAPLIHQTRVLTVRTFVVTCRDPMGVVASLVEAVAMAILNGWIFYQLDGSLAGIRSRQGSLYIASALQGYLILLYETYRLTVDIQVFDRERNEGVVGIIAFLASRRVSRFILEDLPVPLIFSVIFYFMAGFRADPGQFFIFFGITIVGHYIAVTLAMLCVAVSRDFAVASLVANLSYTVQSLACGFFVQTTTIPVYVRWLKWVAYVWYAFGALCTNEFGGQFYSCPYPGGESDPVCKEYTGAFILESLSIPDDWIVRPVCVCLAFAVAFYAGAGLLLKYWRIDPHSSRAHRSDEEAPASERVTLTRSQQSIRPLDIELQGYSMDVQKTSWNLRSRKVVSILKSIDTKFEAGKLNVILGTSGGGKTSLLSAMAMRLHDTYTTKYLVSGRMLLNGIIPSESAIHSICSYVTQDDDALLPSLTVRETLQFAAVLRLPRWMTRAEKRRRADDVILQLGLKDCANTMIGSDTIRGISGGEKRRVSIAIQILTQPRVLFLDEPTSGLDAFTATSIIDVLRGLADEGRTLIVTLHQSRSDLYQRFDNILLLARGGYQVYSGPGNLMLQHFSSLGFECPRTTNPADFALDAITVDLQDPSEETATREKVQTLVAGWSKKQTPSTSEPHHRQSTPAELGGFKKSSAPLHIAYPLLLRRGLVNLRRQPDLVVARFMQVIGLGICLALFFAPLKNDYYSVQTRFGLVAEVTALYFVGMLQNVAVYPTDRDVFYREHEDNAYGVEAFFLQYTSLELPFEVITSLVFAVLLALAAGLPRTPQLFFIMAANCFCIVNCGESIGIIFNTFVRHTGFAVSFMSVWLSTATILAGILSLDVPRVLEAFNYLSPLKYSVANLAPYSLRAETFTCTEAQRLPNGRCPIETGVQALELYNLNGNAPLNLAALGIATVVYRIVAYLVLKAKKTRWSPLRTKKAST